VSSISFDIRWGSLILEVGIMHRSHQASRFYAELVGLPGRQVCPQPPFLSPVGKFVAVEASQIGEGRIVLR
jgi:hypothetical protein